MEWLVQWSGDGAPEVWIRGFRDLLAWGLLGALIFLVPLLALFGITVQRRRFWCAQSRQEVEVEFEERGLPGFRRQVAVKSCSVFDPPEAVACRRRCLDSTFRRQWEPPLPIHTREQP